MRGLVCGRPVSRHDVTSDHVCEHKATRTRPPIGLAMKRGTTR